MVKSERVYSPQDYLEAVTGKCYIINGEDDVGSIGCILEENGIDYLWDYPLSEIEHIVENNLNVVLVDCMVFNDDIENFMHEYRWFEVPEDFEDI